MDQIITCVQCKHWQVFNKESINHFDKNPEEFNCELCHYGHAEHVRFLGKYYACGFCNQVSRSDSCDCQEALEANISTIKITYPNFKKNRVNEKKKEKQTGSLTRLSGITS